MTKIELLAPAKNLLCGIAAINHGADAVYIGGPLFGARKQAGNSIADIAELTTYAHRFNAKVYVALNTLLFDNELDSAQNLIQQIYSTGADALIVQDMGILEMQCPSIELHASTQTDNRNWQKVDFLEKVGFSQVVLARELSLDQIKEIKQKTNVKLEFFIHGALCVSYSGQCYMSHAINGRSANRGECGQACRLTYSLDDKNGNSIAKNKHLLSLKDLNLTNHLHNLAKAGITSFKIEGRLKDVDYVKNITSWYRQKIDEFMLADSNFIPSSSGKCSYPFISSPEKSFSRGFTSYFVENKKEEVWSPDTPKSLGQKMGIIARVESDHFMMANSVSPINNGDGLCFLDRSKEMVGVRVNRSEGLKIFPAQMKNIYSGAIIYRNSDKEFSDALDRSNDNRKISLKLFFKQISDQQFTLTVSDSDGNLTSETRQLSSSEARNPEASIEQIKTQLMKLGGTIYSPESIDVDLLFPTFIPAKEINELRRFTIALHDETRLTNYSNKAIAIEKTNHPFPKEVIDYKTNITNKLAKAFYLRHGATDIEMGFEVKTPNQNIQVMQTKHCLLRSLDMCLIDNPENKKILPLKLYNLKDEYNLEFDCKACEMKIFLALNKKIGTQKNGHLK